jgi:signal transduction histidine kinase
MKVERIPIRELMDECLELKGILAEKYGISLEADLDDDGAFLRGDRGLLRAALNNIIDNSIRHNRQGGKITVGYRCDGTRESIIVSDTGKGIPYDELCSIRHIFCRAGKPSLDESEHLEAGLIGLTIVRDIADLHGGRVGIRSLEGEGTTYNFHLPRCG